MLHEEAHVWLISPESITDPDTLHHCHNTLDEEERVKAGRFLKASDRHLYLVSHALVRSVLSRYSRVSPAAWRFSRGPHGRPEIAPENKPRLRFNLTHTPGLAACIVTLDDDCGIDVEQLRDRNNPSGVAKRMFSASEAEQLRQHKGKAFLEYFYERWTLREAYVKARGIGISFPTHQLNFTVEGSKATVKFDSAIDDCDSEWNFQIIRPNTTHVAAVALRRREGIDKRINVYNFNFTD